MKTYIIHHNDLDGYASAGIAKAFLDKQKIYPNFIEMNYGMTLPDVFKPEDTVYMLDFSLQPFSKMYALKESVETLIWLDHHASAFKDYAAWHEQGKYEALEGAPKQGVTETPFCGAERTWMWFSDCKDIPEAIKLVGDWDTWRHVKIKASEAPFFKTYFDTMSPAQVVEWFSRYALNTFRKESAYTRMADVTDAIQVGRCVKSYEIQESIYLMKLRAFEAKLVVPLPAPSRGNSVLPTVYSVIAANMGARGSDRFASVYNPDKHEMMCGFAYENTGKVTVSLYSTNPDIDCGAIAKRCGDAGPFPGGGGHKGAAGFQTSWEFLMYSLLIVLGNPANG